MTTQADRKSALGVSFSSSAASDGSADGSAHPTGIVCDFCGRAAASVRRVALDRNYERLRTAHVERFACSECSERKERQRLGLERG